MANKAASQAAPNGTTAKERRTLETKPKWPRVIDAPVRDAMPGAIPLGPSGSLDVLEAQRDDWEAPWMVGLVNRVDDGTENDPDSKGGVFNNRRSELDGFDKTGSVDGEVEIIDLVDGTSGQTGRSDLHHEIVRFSEYVSLTPAEVRLTTTFSSGVILNERNFSIFLQIKRFCIRICFTFIIRGNWCDQFFFSLNMLTC